MTLAGKEQDILTAAEDKESKACATIAAAALSDQLSGLSEQLRASKVAIERSETDMTDQEVKGEEKLQVRTMNIILYGIQISTVRCSTVQCSQVYRRLQDSVI
jgi:hypothetical protein